MQCLEKYCLICGDQKNPSPGFWPKRKMIGTVWNGSHWMWTLMIWCLISFEVCCICKYLVLRSNQYIHEVISSYPQAMFSSISTSCYPVSLFWPLIFSSTNQVTLWNPRRGSDGCRRDTGLDGSGFPPFNHRLGDDRLNLVCCHTYSIIVFISCVDIYSKKKCYEHKSLNKVCCILDMSHLLFWRADRTFCFTLPC